MANHSEIHNINGFNMVGESSDTNSEGKFYVHRASGKQFILKDCFNGYEEEIRYNLFRDGQSIDQHPIIAAFIGYVFQLIMKGRAPDHWLIKNKKSVQIASKFLDGFDTCQTMLKNDTNIDEFANVKGINRYLASTIFLSDWDLNFGNFGVMNVNGKKVFAKIDHDLSFKTDLDSFQAFFNRLKDNIQFDFCRKKRAENLLILDQVVLVKYNLIKN